jgi:hypothetical protein
MVIKPSLLHHARGHDRTGSCLLTGDYEERAAILEYEAGLPRDWAEKFARQLIDGPPGDFSPMRWQAAIDGALRFVDQWGREAYMLGWRFEDLFGLHPVAPAARYDCRGLGWLLGDGGQVVAIDDSSATIRTIRGALQHFRRCDPQGSEDASRESGTMDSAL